MAERLAAAEREQRQQQPALEALQAELARANARVQNAQRDLAAQRAATGALEAELLDVRTQWGHATGVRCTSLQYAHQFWFLSLDKRTRAPRREEDP